MQQVAYCACMDQCVGSLQYAYGPYWAIIQCQNGTLKWRSQSHSATLTFLQLNLSLCLTTSAAPLKNENTLMDLCCKHFLALRLQLHWTSQPSSSGTQFISMMLNVCKCVQKCLCYQYHILRLLLKVSQPKISPCVARWHIQACGLTTAWRSLFASTKAGRLRISFSRSQGIPAEFKRSWRHPGKWGLVLLFHWCC